MSDHRLVDDRLRDGGGGVRTAERPRWLTPSEVTSALATAERAVIRSFERPMTSMAPATARAAVVARTLDSSFGSTKNHLHK